jgi:hypothetical protein
MMRIRRNVEGDIGKIMFMEFFLKVFLKMINTPFENYLKGRMKVCTS